MDVIPEDKLRIVAYQQKMDLIMTEKDYFLIAYLFNLGTFI